MDSHTISNILIPVAGIVATGSLSRVGANITDKALLVSEQLLASIKNKLPHIANILQNNDKPIDYGQVYTEIRAVADSRVVSF